MKIRTLEFFKKKMTTSSFPLIHQPDAMDCGPACLGMIAKYYGKDYDINGLRKNSYIGRDGVSMLGISRAGEQMGFRGWRYLRIFERNIRTENCIMQLPFGMRMLHHHA